MVRILYHCEMKYHSLNCITIKTNKNLLMAKFDWISKRTPRSVDELKLWAENPRLNPDVDHITLSDYAQDLLLDEGERESFIDLLKSISTYGFIQADPIVVCKISSNEKLYVVEGNRRVLALKLLRAPQKAPLNIRPLVRKCSERIDKSAIRKILVSIAPSLEDAEWYINQRHNAASIQKSWSRIQQQRWIAKLYEKYQTDIETMMSITSMSKSEIEQQIRYLKIKDYIKLDDVKKYLTDKEDETANSYRFPITILERFFSYAEVKSKWGIIYDGPNVIINAKMESFYRAFAELIKRIVSESINTRMKAEDAPGILESLPSVELASAETHDENAQNKPSEANNTQQNDNIAIPDQEEVKSEKTLKNNVNRNRLVLHIYEVDTTDAKIKSLFEELKTIPLKYSNAVSASIRIFLDVAVRDYIMAEGLEEALCKAYKSSLREIQLYKRISYLKDHKLTGEAKSVAEKLLNNSNEYSLDVLNGYIHSSCTAYTYKQFINGFWDFLFPLFQSILDIKEIEE